MFLKVFPYHPTLLERIYHSFGTVLRKLVGLDKEKLDPDLREPEKEMKFT